MKLVIISGRSGSGKSTALKVLEDIGFYCIDNLPAALLPALINEYKNETDKQLATCIDARSNPEEITHIGETLSELPKSLSVEVIYLDATNSELIKRFSETRRKHPLSTCDISLQAAIDKEKIILDPIANIADLHINTNQMNVHDLRSLIKKRLDHQCHDKSMALLFTSFGFKHGIPVDADMVFDVRCLPNPHWEPLLRELSGLDSACKRFLAAQEDVKSMLKDICDYLENWLPKFTDANRSYLTVAIGCTGGQHRSVFIAHALQEHFASSEPNCQVHHRELSKKNAS
ncbi:MAG: RNase adapter RapZ [Sinobacterium sp.]|nr:RNase adapter RapZ [Sinobacterium sp.]